ncbi:hypothetical protein [Saccharothrix longispora]|uniref:hypothetical protein n=1 Tax=Saccharothrix longispora TaxID=33920 RepID=UPI0028FD967A|nr:hypothetical protein [Saccharothrix longispora]MDU0287751.1 hypothetical protein [Saccharothrix longispora]
MSEHAPSFPPERPGEPDDQLAPPRPAVTSGSSGLVRQDGALQRRDRHRAARRADVARRTDVPLRLRRLLDVESGPNDGLALPFVLIFLATSTHDAPHPVTIALELVLGLVVGVAVAGAITLAWRRPNGRQILLLTNKC